MKKKAWYDADVPDAPTTSELRAAGETWQARRKRESAAGLGSCLIYPLRDGPGVAMLVFFPPILFLLSLPVFDWIAIVDPFRKGNWALGLLALPIFLPLITTFALVFGYCLLIAGQMLVASALGEFDHPPWPEWNSSAISEGLVRWLWAGVFGVVLGGFPMMVYWLYCGNIDWFDRIVFAELAIAGAGYGQMALAAGLLHDSLLAANPITVFASILRIGWDYVQPALVGGVAVLLAVGALWSVFFVIESQSIAFVALWGFWVLVLYEAMVVFRLLGMTYHAHAEELEWFRRRPKWASSSRSGQLYSHS
jgi:hypothetical protein